MQVLISTGKFWCGIFSPTFVSFTANPFWKDALYAIPICSGKVAVKPITNPCLHSQRSKNYSISMVWQLSSNEKINIQDETQLMYLQFKKMKFFSALWHQFFSPLCEWLKVCRSYLEAGRCWKDKSNLPRWGRSQMGTQQSNELLCPISNSLFLEDVAARELQKIWIITFLYCGH